MTDAIEIEPSGTLNAVIRPPGSKSITNRALVCAALADGRSTLTGALESEDTLMMTEALRLLGVGVAHDPSVHSIRVFGCGGRLPAAHANLFVANSGTTIRFLTAVATLGHGDFRLDGSPRMRQRPIADLLNALNQLGAEVASEFGNGCPPVLVKANGLPGGFATVASNMSSQYLSGLLMAAPCARQPVELHVDGELVSKPFVEMTLRVMSAFGVETGADRLSRFVVPPNRRYHGQQYAIEPDASAASYFFAAAAITGGQVTVEGLSRGSLQGDVAFCDCLEQMGCTVKYGDDEITVIGGPLHGVRVNMNSISDTVQTLSVVALFAEGPTHIFDVANIRHKETDRIGALVTELRKRGIRTHTRKADHYSGNVLTPLGLDAAIRVSFCHYNSMEEITAFLAAMQEIVDGV